MEWWKFSIGDHVFIMLSPDTEYVGIEGICRLEHAPSRCSSLVPLGHCSRGGRLYYRLTYSRLVQLVVKVHVITLLVSSLSVWALD